MKRSARPLRAGFVMEQVLGHVTHYHTLRRILAGEPAVDSHWVEVTYTGDGWLEQSSHLPSSVSGTLRGFLQVRGGLRRRSFDALFFHTQKPAVFNWDLLARIPSVLSLDVTPKQYDELGLYYDHVPDGRTATAALKHWMNVRTFSLARQIVVWSRWVGQSLETDYAVPSHKIRVIPPGINFDWWKAPAQPPSRPGLPRVLFVGGDFERKGGDLLLRWFREQGRDRCELDLVTRANVPEEPGVRVHRGIVGNSQEARRLFFAADLFVLPSLGECFGIAAIEAMAARLPVVMTSVGGAGDIVRDGETGYLIEPGNGRALAEALDALLSDPSARTAMGGRGRAIAETSFDAVTNARALLDCLFSVADERLDGAWAAANAPFRKMT